MKVLFLVIAIVLGAPLHAKPNVDMNDISCIEAATSGPRGEYTGQQIHMILLSIENYWKMEFARRGQPFQEVGYRVFHGNIMTGCGPASSDSGPFYCMGDGVIYVDPLFFYTRTALERFGNPTQAILTFILAHEFGHHIQNLLNVMPRVNNHARMRFGGGFYIPNIDWGPQMEYQADCLGGVFLHQLYQRGLLTMDEVHENVQLMVWLGDDFQSEILRRQLQGQQSLASGGYSHGTSANRQRWMVRGVKSGDMNQCESFEFKTLN